MKWFKNAADVITGIRCSLDNDTTRKEFALSVQGPEGWQRFGVRTQHVEAHHLRPGMPVVVKTDGSRDMLDWEAMAWARGICSQFLTQDSKRTPPDDGVIDNALDARVQSHLTKWAPTAATIVSLERLTVMGRPTLNWHIQMRLPDGTLAMSQSDDVPSDAQWDVARDVEVPAGSIPRVPPRCRSTGRRSSVPGSRQWASTTTHRSGASPTASQLECALSRKPRRPAPLMSVGADPT